MDSKEYKAGHRYGARIFNDAVRAGGSPDDVELLPMEAADDVNWYKGCEMGVKDAKNKYKMCVLKEKNPGAYYNLLSESGKYHPYRRKEDDGYIQEPAAKVDLGKLVRDAENVRRDYWLAR
jgi:hypothetical protein